MSTTINGTTGIDKIQDGTITNADINASAAIAASKLSGTGKVLQVVYDYYSVERANSTSTYVDTGLDASITPTSSSSTILAFFTVSGVGKEIGNTAVDIQVLHNVNGGAYTNAQFYGSRAGMNLSSAKNNIGSVSGCYEFSPATTSVVNVKAQFRSQANISATQVQETNARSTMVLMEIAG